MKKITVSATVKIDLHVDETADVEAVLNEMEYNFQDTTGTATVADSEIQDFKITDAR